MGFFEAIKNFFKMCIKGAKKFLSQTINVLWQGLKYAVKLIYDGAYLIMDFIVSGIQAYDFIIDSINQLKNAGLSGNFDKLFEEVRALKNSNAQIECFTYKIKNQDAKTIFC